MKKAQEKACTFNIIESHPKAGKIVPEYGLSNIIPKISRKKK